jgi:hypothetical protein
MRRGNIFLNVYYSKVVYHACNKGIIQSPCGVILVPQPTSPKLRVLKVSQGLKLFMQLDGFQWRKGVGWCPVMPLALGFTVHLWLFKKINLMGPIPRSRYRQTIL